MKKIAVFLDQDYNMNNFYNCDKFIVYEKNNENYSIAAKINYEKIIPSSPNKIRQDVNTLISLIKDCKTAAFGEISGIPYSAFDMAGYNIFQIADYSEDTLDGIFDDIEKLSNAEKQRDEMIENARPVETQTKGVYYFDLIKVQEACPDVSSKKALLEFFNSTPFMELNLVCAHIPPWIERDRRFKVKSEKTNKGYNAVISFRQC